MVAARQDPLVTRDRPDLRAVTVSLAQKVQLVNKDPRDQKDLLVLREMSEQLVGKVHKAQPDLEDHKVANAFPFG